MRVGANTGKGKFGHVGLGHDHRAPRAQPTQHRRVGRGRRRVGEHLRPRARRLTSDIEQVFDGDDGTIERTEVCADTRPRIRRFGCGAGGLGIHGETRPGTLAVRVGDASKRLFQPVLRGTGRRRADPGRLCLRPHNVGRGNKRRGRTREMQELTTNHLHFFLLAAHFSLMPADGAAAAAKNQDFGTSCRRRLLQ